MKIGASETGGVNLWMVLCVVGLVGFLNVVLANFVDSDKDGIDDAFEAQHGYTTDGLYPGDLLGWWQWDGEATDRSANGADGTLSGFAAGSEYGTGAYYDSLNFDDDSVVTFTDASKFDLGGDFSYSVWISGNTAVSGTKIVEWVGANGDSWELNIDASGLVEAIFTDEVATATVLQSATNVRDGNWNHVVVTWGGLGTMAKLYINGSEESSAIVANWSAGSAASFEMGVASGNGSFSMDETMLFDRELVTTDIPHLPETDYDLDADGLSSLDESIAGSDPSMVDTDGDLLNDGDEILVHGTDPTEADTDGDGVNDLDEISAGEDPRSIPSGWLAKNVAKVAGESYYVQEDSTFEITSPGRMGSYTADKFHFVYRTLENEGQLVAKLESLSHSGAEAVAGVMLRQTGDPEIRRFDDPRAKYLFIGYRAGGGLTIRYRTEYLTKSEVVDHGVGVVPGWLKIAREGSLSKVYTSVDGVDWTLQFARSFDWTGSDPHIGLAATSNENDVAATAEFKHVSVSGDTSAATFTKPWLEADIGGTDTAGSASVSGGVWTLSGYGHHGTEDAQYYVAQQVMGYGEISGELGGVSGPAGSRAGLEARSGHGIAAQKVGIWRTADHKLILENRDSGGALAVQELQAGLTSPVFAKLTYESPEVKVEYSLDGVTWVEAGSLELDTLLKEAWLGVALESGASGQEATGVIENVALDGLPQPWVSSKLGNENGDTIAGKISDIYTIAAKGERASAAADTAHFVHRPLLGNGEIVAKVVAVDGGSAQGRAGIMVREDLSDGSRMGFLAVGNDGSVTLESRESLDGEALKFGEASSGSGWLKLVREGKRIDAYRSGDGETWDAVDSMMLTTEGTLYLGLAAYGGETAWPLEAHFENVKCVTYPDIWTDETVGNLYTRKGYGGEADGVFYLRGTGEAMDDDEQDGYWVYRELEGDGEVVARITRVGGTPEAVAGVMISDRSTPKKKQAFIGLKPGASGTETPGEIFYRDQSTTGNIPVTEEGPMWVKAAKSGELLSLWYSVDGDDWILAHHVTYEMGEPNYVGFFYTSGDPKTWGGATFENANVSVGSTFTDMDGDGYSDLDEINEMFTDPLVADAFTPITVAGLNGDQGSQNSGEWATENGKIYNTGLRGGVGYTFDVVTPGIHQIRFEAEEIANPGTDGKYDIWFKLDGERIKTLSLLIDPDEADKTQEAVVYTPWLEAGTHTVELFFDNLVYGRSLAINSVEVNYIDGADADSDGIPDWMENRMENLNDVGGTGPVTSAVSPFNLEGFAEHFGGVAVQVGPQDYEAKQAIGNNWYADVDLDPAATTAIEITYEGGASSETLDVTWTATNLLDADVADVWLRLGDSLLFDAVPAGETAGDVTVTVSGGTGPDVVLNTTVGAPISHEFASAGTYTVTGSWDDGGTPQSNSITVTAVGSSFAASPMVLGEGRNYLWENPDLGDDVVVEYDNRFNRFKEVTEEGDTGRVFQIRHRDGVFESYHVVARLGENGPIVDSQEIRAIRFDRSGEVLAQVTETLSDGSHKVSLYFVATDLDENFSLEIDIWRNGVTFEDGTTLKTFTADDFGPDGLLEVIFISGGSNAAICHRLSILDGEITVL